MIMKLLIAGSRGIDRFDLSGHVPPETEVIISGGAKVIDTVAEKYAEKIKHIMQTIIKIVCVVASILYNILRLRKI